MMSHVSKHAKYLKKTTKEHHKVSGKLLTITGQLIFKCLLNKIICISKLKTDGFIYYKKRKTGQINNIQAFDNTRLQHPHNQLVNSSFESKAAKPTQNIVYKIKIYTLKRIMQQA